MLTKKKKKSLFFFTCFFYVLKQVPICFSWIPTPCLALKLQKYIVDFEDFTRLSVTWGLTDDWIKIWGTNLSFNFVTILIQTPFAELFGSFTLTTVQLPEAHPDTQRSASHLHSARLLWTAGELSDQPAGVRGECPHAHTNSLHRADAQWHSDINQWSVKHTFTLQKIYSRHVVRSEGLKEKCTYKPLGEKINPTNMCVQYVVNIITSCRLALEAASLGSVQQ